MESKRSYRDTGGRDIRLPKEVYYRCLWTVRDADRLRRIADVLGFEESEDNTGHKYMTITGDDPENCSELRAVIVSDDVAMRAAAELECIDRSLAKIPEVYREPLLDNIQRKDPFPDFAHPNTWKRWKLVLLFELAKELRLI